MKNATAIQKKTVARLQNSSRGNGRKARVAETMPRENAMLSGYRYLGDAHFAGQSLPGHCHAKPYNVVHRLFFRCSFLVGMITQS